MRTKIILKKCALATAISAGVFAHSALATDFYFGENDDIELRVNNKITVGISKRLEDPDLDHINTGNGGFAPSSAGDDGNLNFDDGDTVSEIYKGLTELELTYDNVGAVVKFKYWYDRQLKDEKVAHGNLANGFEPNAKLSDDGFDDFAKFSGIELLDAYVWGQFDIGEMPLDIRVGRQVVNWGESTFIQGGLSSINPFDVSAFRRPGAELKEGLLPVGMVYANIGLTDTLSLEAFYQYEWEKTQVDGCGTFFSTTDYVASGCEGVVLGGAPDKTLIEAGYVADRKSDIEPDDGGQYGAALRYVAESLNDTEFGLYYFNVHSRLPLISIQRSNTSSVMDGAPVFVPSSLDPTGGALTAENPAYLIEFPEDLKYYGVTFASNVGGLALSGEVTYKPDTPIQIAGAELLNGAFTENPLFAYTSRLLESEPGGYTRGWDEYDVTQVQMTGVQFYDQVLGASRLTVIVEAGVVLTDDAEKSQIGIGRHPTFGLGDQTADLAAAIIEAMGGPAGLDCEQSYATLGLGGDCSSEGFTTDSAWGYRARAILEYPNVFAGVSLKPSIAWSHDVDGYAPNPAAAFVEDRKVLGLGLNALYKSIYSVDLNYVANHGGDYNLNSDRDFWSASFTVSF